MEHRRRLASKITLTEAGGELNGGSCLETSVGEEANRRHHYGRAEVALHTMDEEHVEIDAAGSRDLAEWIQAGGGNLAATCRAAVSGL